MATTDVEKQIGNTPLIRLENVEKRFQLSARLYAKAEYCNAGGSIKDRVAQAILRDAEEKGALKRGGTVVEATSGNTGIGLALVAAARGYNAIIVMPETMSVERQGLIKKYGAKVVLTSGEKGMQGAVEKANEIVKNTENCILAGQFDNPVCANVHYESTAPEICNQIDGVDIFVAGVGTGGTITGVGRYLKARNAKTRIVGVEPSKSPLLSKGYAGAHGLQGIGANFIPSVLDRSVLDEVVCVSEEDAFATAKTLLNAEKIFAGISSGAAVFAAIELAKRPENAGKSIVTILPDSGDRYASVGLFD